MGYVATHLACKLVVDGVAGPRGYYASFDGLSYQGHVAYNVKQLVACAFVFPHQGLVLYVAKLGGVAVLYMEHVGQFVKLLL